MYPCWLFSLWSTHWSTLSVDLCGQLVQVLVALWLALNSYWFWLRCSWLSQSSHGVKALSTVCVHEHYTYLLCYRFLWGSLPILPLVLLNTFISDVSFIWYFLLYFVSDTQVKMLFQLMCLLFRIFRTVTDTVSLWEF